MATNRSFAVRCGIVSQIVGVSALLFIICLGAFAGESIVRVAMSDGLELETIVVQPDGDGPWPVILERTPYNCHTAFLKTLGFTERGYAVVAQNIRGTGKSAGEWTVFGNDGWGGSGSCDGVDTVAWIRAQPWSNGRVGVFGGSASGIAAQLLVAAAPEGLACAYVNAASDNLYESMFPGGCYRTNTVDTWPQAEPMRAEIKRHPMYDGFWRIRDARSRCNVADVPVYVTGVWFDLFQRSTAAYFRGQQTNWLPRSDGNCKMVILPGAHGAPPGQLEYPDRANKGPDAEIGSMLEWFDYWLKDIDNGILVKPSVGIFLMTDKDAPEADGNRLLTMSHWPPRTRRVKLYLQDNAGLSAKVPEIGNASRSYRYDPANPAPSIGGNNLFPPSGPHDQREIETREDVLEFTTQPLTGAVTVIGPITVTLWASTDALDTDFVARLCDVYPDGRSMLYCEGIVRARYRESNTSETFLPPNTPCEFMIDLWDTALTFAPGHRIRVDIASSSVPRYDANPNTGEPILQHTKSVVATNTIHFDKRHASHVELPLTNWRQARSIPQ